MKQKIRTIPPFKIILSTVAVIIGIAVFIIVFLIVKEVPSTKEDRPTVTTISTLKQIVNISELSTYASVYNGVASQSDDKDPDKILYYVSYKAKVNAGIDFSQIDIVVDDEAKTITATLPDVKFTSVTVDASSLDYIFLDDKANTSTVSAQALSLCKQDVETETQELDAILDLAKENATNIVTASLGPILQQTAPGYTLHVV